VRDNDVDDGPYLNRTAWGSVDQPEMSTFAQTDPAFILLGYDAGSASGRCARPARPPGRGRYDYAAACLPSSKGGDDYADLIARVEKLSNQKVVNDVN
jgi:hypothetical protein